MKIFKRILILTLSLSLALCNSYVFADSKDGINVYITVTDITDENEPFCYLVPRRSIRVENFDISAFGSTLAQINTTKDTSYMHALVQLHRILYGDENVSSKLAVTESGETKYFMGRSVESIMYKNGNSILSLPQNVKITEGDEINICLYNAGHQQGIASFNEAYIKAELNQKINLKLFEHYGYPLVSSPIDGAEIINSDGTYVEQNGGQVKTDKKGEFSLSFAKAGLNIISAMPKYNYYMSESSVGTTEWVLEKVLVGYNKKISAEKPNGNYTVSETTLKKAKEELSNAGYVVVCWDDEETLSVWDDLDAPFYEEKLVEKEVTSQGATKPAFSHTTPVVVIDVTDELWIKEVTANESGVNVKIGNASLYGGTLVCAAYSRTEDGKDVFAEMKTVPVCENMTFLFEKTYPKYKIMCLESLESLKPLSQSAESN